MDFREALYLRLSKYSNHLIGNRKSQNKLELCAVEI